MHFKVSAVLPIDARTFLIERDSAAFRALVARTQNVGALEIREGWADGDVQVGNMRCVLFTRLDSKIINSKSTDLPSSFPL